MKSSQHSQHNIAIRKSASGQSIRRACKLCYANKRSHTNRSKARENVKKTTTFCPDCPDKPQLCIVANVLKHFIVCFKKNV